ncbi:hypothetical protein [Nocardia cyriacigeorgica]|uniref:Uncharacterized protein n=1 Tax=Nocardia cyriacigeorgica TaxID=135487 RepID=A0A5R8NB05_9NOCA|nr:hypothetical protein [Nocardia cyriacigeorgica]TLF72895.1 hypothetical protein FEK34_28135 [Nocardia cyriacigeorgica]
MNNQTPAPLTDDELREIADTADAEMLPDETVQAIAAELLGARAYVDEVVRGRDGWREVAEHRLEVIREAVAELNAAHARVTELEQTATLAAACRPPEIHDRPTDTDLAALVRALDGTGDPAYVLGAELIEKRARIAELEAQQPYREVWSDDVAPGGRVCGTCGVPVESEPCPKHAPAEDPQRCDCGTCQAIASARAAAAMASVRETLADKLSECTYEGMSPRETADALVLAGWRPPAREITNPAELDTLPYGSVVMPRHCDPFKRKTLPEGLRWTGESFPDGLTSAQLISHYTAIGCPITVVHVPTEEADTDE